MAGIAVTYSNGSLTGVCTDPDGDWGGLILTINAVRYVASTNKLEIDWTTNYTSKASGRPNLNAMQCKIGGVQCFFDTGSPIVSYSNSTYKNGGVYKTYQSSGCSSITIDASKGTTQSVTLFLKILGYWGYNTSNWNDTSRAQETSGTMSVTVPGDPTISVSVSKTSAGRGASNGSATTTISATAGTNGGSITAYSNTNNGSTNTSTTNTASSLKNNTSYSYSATVTNTYGLSKSTSGTYVLDGVAPAVSNSSSSVARTSATVTASATYDTNASFSSGAVQYGTTTSYGTNVTLSASSLSKSITGLSPNTTYHYRAYITDNQGRTGYSADHTFTTTGNAPSASRNTSQDVIGRKYAQIGFSYTCDTNASWGSGSFVYGTTTSYGSTGTVDSNNHFFAGGTSESSGTLTPNTKYYFKFTITDNWGRTSAAVTGNFTTSGNIPTVTTTHKSVTRVGATVTVSASYDTNASFSSGAVQYGTTTSYESTASITSVGDKALSNLTPNTKYYYRAYVTDTFGRTGYSSGGNFTTLGNNPSVTATVSDVLPTTAVLTYSATFDTNASRASANYEYGTTSSYGTSVTITTNSGSATLTNLLPNTTYYWRVSYTDNFNRTGAVTGTFITLVGQASVFYKSVGGWVSGKLFYKTANGWVKAKKVYIKTNSGWKEGI